MSESTSRRAWLRALALAAPASAISVPASADEPKAPSEVDARMGLILARFGDKLDPEARKLVRAEVESIVRRVEELRKVKLTNADGPFPVFSPFRAPLS